MPKRKSRSSDKYPAWNSTNPTSNATKLAAYPDKKTSKKEKGDSDEEIMKYVNKKVEGLRNYLVNPDKGSDSLTPIQKQDSAATDSLLVSAAQIDLVNNVIDNRLIEVATLGVASGDGTPISYGMWVRGMFSQAKQNSHKLVPGYKLNQHGATIGFDAGEEDARLGIAYSFVDSKVKGTKTGIKDKVKSHIVTIYGLYGFENNMFVDGQIRLGKSNIKKTLRLQNIDLEINQAALNLLSQKGYDPAFGARPLKRVIQREIQNNLAKLLLSGKISSGGKS